MPDSTNIYSAVTIIDQNKCAHVLDKGCTAMVCKYCGAGMSFQEDWTWVLLTPSSTVGYWYA